MPSGCVPLDRRDFTDPACNTSNGEEMLGIVTFIQRALTYIKLTLLYISCRNDPFFCKFFFFFVNLHIFKIKATSQIKFERTDMLKK